MEKSQIVRLPRKYTELFLSMSNEEVWKLIKNLLNKTSDIKLEWIIQIYYNMIIVDLDNLENSAMNWWKWWRPKKKITPGYEKEKPPVMKNDNLKEIVIVKEEKEYSNNTKDNTIVLSAFREIADKESHDPYKYFLWVFINLWWIPWKSDTIENIHEWMRDTLKNWWVLTWSDAVQVLREFHSYWNTKRDDPWYSKKNWKTTLVNSPSLPHNKTKYAIKK